MAKYCDFSCEHAEFPPENCDGACRTFTGVYCRKKEEIVAKNSRCKLDG